MKLFISFTTAVAVHLFLEVFNPAASAATIKQLSVGSPIVITETMAAQLTKCGEVAGIKFLKCRVAEAFSRSQITLPPGTRAVITKIRRVHSPTALSRFIGHQIYFRVSECTENCGIYVQVGRVFTVFDLVSKTNPYATDFEVPGIQNI